MRRIVRRYERAVFNLIARMVRDSTLAEDVAQDAFVKAFRSLAGFDTARRFSSWIFRIANNAALDAVRRRRANPVVNANVPEPLASPVADQVETAALGSAIDQALSGLVPNGGRRSSSATRKTCRTRNRRRRSRSRKER